MGHEEANARVRWVMVRMVVAVLLMGLYGCSDVRVPNSASAACKGDIGTEESSVVREDVKALVAKLGSPDASVRQNAAREVVRLRSKAVSAVPSLVKALDDPNDTVQYFACVALGMMGSGATDATPALLKKLGSQWAGIRIASIFAVRETCSPQDSRLLIDLLLSDNAYARASAAFCLGHCGADNRNSVGALAKALGDRDAMVRRNAAMALGELGGRASRTNDVLTRVAGTDKDARVRCAAVDALPKVGLCDRACITVLVDALKDEDYWVRMEAAEGIGDLGCAAQSARAAVHKALEDSKPEVRVWATYAAIRLDPNGEQGVSDLLKYVRGQFPMQEKGMEGKQNLTPNMNAVDALGKMGPGAAGAIPTLMAMLPQFGLDDYVCIVRAMREIGPEAIKALERAQQSDDPEMRKIAVWILKGLRMSADEFNIRVTLHNVAQIPWWE
jgi:HEAT repeat protein